jgi:hypothetical protein|tara:strand:+ start:2882 stop:3430 length:549 start_codon:yes stop_codon:yes gene_type:complete
MPGPIILKIDFSRVGRSASFSAGTGMGMNYSFLLVSVDATISQLPKVLPGSLPLPRGKIELATGPVHIFTPLSYNRYQISLRGQCKVHGGDEVTIACLKYMNEGLAEEFVKNTDESGLARSLQTNPADGGVDSEIVNGFDENKGSHFVEVKFYMEVIDIENIEKWCATEGFEILERTFGSHL